MKLLNSLKKAWESHNEKLIQKDEDNPGISFMEFIQFKIDNDKTLKTILSKVEYLKSILEELEMNQYEIGNEMEKKLNDLNLLEQYYSDNPKMNSKQKLQYFETLNEYNHRFLYIKELRIQILLKLNYWTSIADNNSSLVPNKITWLKNKTDLTVLFDKLESLGFVSFVRKKDEILRKHFNWSEGEIKKGTLKSSRNNIKNKPELYQESDEMKEVLDGIKSKVVKGS